MADILRAPLVSQAQRKRPIAPVDYFGRPLTLGINQSAALDLPLISGRLFESAPRKRWQPDSLQSQGLIVYDGPEAAVASLTDSAPRVRKALGLEHPANLLTTTLAQAPGLSLPHFAARLDLAAPRSRPQPRVDALSRPLTLGINPNAAVTQQSDSATPRKRSSYGFDPPNLLVGTLAEALALPLTAGRVDASAPILKYQARVESLYRPVTLGINPNAVVVQLNTTAPPPKRSAYTFDPPNLIATTLAERLELPRFAGRLDWSAPPPSAPKYLDAEPRFSPDTPIAPSVTPRGIRVVVVSAQSRRVQIKPH